MEGIGEVTSAERLASSYRTYKRAWLCLLALTVLMVVTGSSAVVIPGIAVKALIIALVFMHLKRERVDFALGILFSIFATGGLLFALIAPDGIGSR